MAYPDALALLVTYLDGLFTTQVASRVPSPRPTELIQIRQVGGAQVRPVRDRTVLDVFCWAATDPAAWAIAEPVRRAILGLGGTNALGVMCYRAEEFLSPRQFDDAETGSPRYWATYALVIRANDAIQH